MYSLLVIGLLVTTLGAALPALPGALDDAPWLRVTLTVMLALVALLVRITGDVLAATRP